MAWHEDDEGPRAAAGVARRQSALDFPQTLGIEVTVVPPVLAVDVDGEPEISCLVLATAMIVLAAMLAVLSATLVVLLSPLSLLA